MAGVDETLGLLAHPGGVLVDHPRLRIGVVSAVSRPDGLSLDLIGRSPRNPDSMTDPPAPRVLLPRYDEGLNLRVGWLDADGRPHWVYGSTETGTGPAFGGGTILRTRLRLPSMSGDVKLVLAWPEIGFPEAVVTLSLPDRDAVVRASASIWTAPVNHHPVPSATFSGTARPALDVEPEAGLVLTGQRVLHRGDDAVVVLTRLTSVGPALSIEVSCLARGRRGGIATMASMYGIGRRTGPEAPRDRTAGAAVAVLEGDQAHWLALASGMTGGGDDVFESRSEYAFERTDSDVLNLVVGWSATDLPDAHVRLPLTRY
jgi:hypothetical protein